MDRSRKQSLWFLAGFLGIGLILFWRCFYSVNTTDEAYYIGTVYRLWTGDGMLCDEWNPTQQMCSFWLYPFYALFRLILGSNEGMILAFRLLYVVFQLLLSGYLYQRLQKFGNIRMFAVLFYLLSTAFNINSLSYNTMANSALIALLATLSTMKEGDWKDAVWAGLFASVLVMANPYALFAYLLYGIASLCVSVLFRKKEKMLPAALQFRTFWRMSLTAAVVFLAFLAFTLWHASIDRILRNLPYIIGDQEHVQRWDVKIFDYFRYFREHYLGCTVVPLAVTLAAILDRKRVEHGALYMGLNLLVILPYMIYHGVISDYVPVNLVTVPVSMLGLTAYVVSKEKMKRVFYTWYLPALFYPFIVQITSNTGILAVSAGFMTAGAAAVMLSTHWATEQDRKSFRWVIYGVLFLQLTLMLFLRITYVWADGELSELDTRVTRGAAKGIYTSAEKVQYYNELYDDLDALEMREKDDFLVVGSDPLLYLYAERKVASYSTWQVYADETRLYRYYEVESGRFPSVIYCVDADETVFESILVDAYLLPMGYEWEELAHGIAFYTAR